MATQNKNFVIKNGLTVGTHEIIDVSGNIDVPGGSTISIDGVPISQYTPPTDQGALNFLSGDGTYKQINLSGYATETYADTVASTAESTAIATSTQNTATLINDLVDGAPTELNTLNKIATELGNKADLTGSNFTGAVSATYFYGDGSNLTNIPASDWADITNKPANILTKTNTVAAAGQTSFAASYTVGGVEVFLNGIKLKEGTDYTATDGSTIVLTVAADENDEIDITAHSLLTEYVAPGGLSTGSFETSGTTSQVIDSWNTDDYRSAKYVFTVTGATGYMSLEMLCMYNDVSAINSQYAEIGANLGTFDTTMNGTILEVMFTPVDSTAVVQFSRTTIDNIV